MEELFQFLDKKGLSQSKADKNIASLSSSKLLDIINEARTLLVHPKEKSLSSFEFIANSPLSGRPIPCALYKCRAKRVDNLARFAALYADRVLIRDPFEHYQSLGEIKDLHRMILFDDLRLLHVCKTTA